MIPAEVLGGMNVVESGGMNIVVGLLIKECRSTSVKKKKRTTTDIVRILVPVLDRIRDNLPHQVCLEPLE
jgi:hypothetical protein